MTDPVQEPSFSYTAIRHDDEGTYDLTLNLWDFPPNAAVPVRGIFVLNGVDFEHDLETVTTDESGVGTVTRDGLSCSDTRGVCVGVSATHPDGSILAERHSMDLPCGLS